MVMSAAKREAPVHLQATLGMSDRRTSLPRTQRPDDVARNGLRAVLLPGKSSDTGRTGSDNRLFVNGGCGVCSLVRIGVSCRNARTNGKRCILASVAGDTVPQTWGWERVFEALTVDRDNNTDARQHHRPCAPAGCERKREEKDQALGRSREGLTTKIDFRSVSRSCAGRSDAEHGARE